MTSWFKNTQIWNKLRLSKIILEKEKNDKFGDLHVTHSYFKIYYKTIIIIECGIIVKLNMYHNETELRVQKLSVYGEMVFSKPSRVII